MHFPRALCFSLTIVAVAASLGACDGGASLSRTAPALPTFGVQRHSVGLGATLTAKDGEIYGFDIAQDGSIGILATASDVETFDPGSGKILTSYPKKLPYGNSYSADGIFTGNVGLITRYVVPRGKIYAKRYYDVVDPTTKGKFTAKWTPPIKDINVEAAGPNQSIADTAVFAIELKSSDDPVLLVSNIAKNTFSKVITLDPNTFLLGDQPQLAQDTKTNQAVFALSPDGGRVGGEAPINVLINMKTGKSTQFTGLNNGPYGSGFVNGLAVDSATGIAATDTELNAQVEFYDLAKETGTAAQLPCTGSGSQLNSGSGIAGDSTNQLFLVTDTYYCSGKGSAIVVYDETGKLVEEITGFTFSIGEGAPALDPAARMGWVAGPGSNQLQQFFY